MMGSDADSLVKGDGEHKLPLNWQKRFAEIVARLVEGDFAFGPDMDDIEPFSSAEKDRFVQNVQAYGDRLIHLDQAVWRSSIYAWANGHWAVLVDLTTENEPVSDLVLHARIIDDDPVRIVLDSIHVP